MGSFEDWSDFWVTFFWIFLCDNDYRYNVKRV